MADDEKVSVSPEPASEPIVSLSQRSEEKAGNAMTALARTFAENAVASLMEPDAETAAAEGSYTQLNCSANLSMRISSDNAIESMVITPFGPPRSQVRKRNRVDDSDSPAPLQVSAAALKRRRKLSPANTQGEPEAVTTTDDTEEEHKSAVPGTRELFAFA